MTDQNSPESAPETETIEAEVVVEPNRLQKFVLNHPRAAKVIAIAGGATALLGSAVMTNNVRKNRHRVVNAATDVSDAIHEIGEAVSPSSPSPETND